MKSSVLPRPLLGIDNQSPAVTDLQKRCVRRAVNVDLDNQGVARRRRGYQVHTVFDHASNLYTCKNRESLLFTADDALYELRQPFASPDVLATGLSPAVRLAFTEYNGNVYFTSPQGTHWIPADSRVPRLVGLPPPSMLTASATSVGSLPPGHYKVAFTHTNARGEESAASPIQEIELAETGGIAVVNPTPISTATVHVYATTAEGGVLQRIDSFPAGMDNYVVTASARGRNCETLALEPLPGGEHLAWHAGRLYVGKGNILYFSRPLRPHLHHPAHDVIPFVGALAFVLALPGGIFVGDERGVWFLRGMDPEDYSLSLVSRERPVRHSGQVVEGFAYRDSIESIAVWLTERGFLAGRENGEVFNLSTQRYAPPGQASRATYTVTREQTRQLIALPI